MNYFDINHYFTRYNLKTTFLFLVHGTVSTVKGGDDFAAGDQIIMLEGSIRYVVNYFDII